MSAAVEQSRRKVNMVAWGDGKFCLEDDPRIPPNKKKTKRPFDDKYFFSTADD